MYAVEQMKEFLKSYGWMTLTNLKKEINLVAEQITDNEIIESAGTAVRGKIALKEYLVVLTPERIITVNKDKKIISHYYDNVTKATTIDKLGFTEILFLYNGEEVQFKITQNDNGRVFAQSIQDRLGVSSAIQPDADERKIVRVMKPIKMSIDILNGKEQLKDKGSVFKLTQIKQGEVEIQVDYHNAPETFKLIKWERVENIQKSAMDIAGWTVIGSAFGNSGAIAGAMGANVGKDKSVATLFLKRENGEKIALVIKCDKKVLQALSLLIVDETHNGPPQDSPSQVVSAADEILKYKELLDMGILTQEEFDSKKKQLLGL